jgi:hypothetical protein
MISKLQAARLLDLDEEFVRHNIFNPLVSADPGARMTGDLPT